MPAHRARRTWEHMRILATNPDTIGDLVLREPLYRALREAGHELIMLVQPLVAPLVPLVAPGAEVITLDLNAYEASLTPDSDALDALAERARAAEPEMLLVAPYQWTAVDARLSRELPDARRVAFNGVPFFHPDLAEPPDWAVLADTLLDVDEDTPELAKNKKLAGAVLGKAVRLGDPRLEPLDEQLAAADAVLDGAGLDADAYWVACVGHPPHAAVRNWPLERWTELLAGWAERHDRRFLVIGGADERETAREVIEGLDEGVASDWFGATPDDLDTLVGLCARSRGYVGRDTGPMHIAGALGRPVLAVFGAGTWPRFAPAVDPSIAVTVGVPTAGCGWDAKVEAAYAIREVPLEMMARGADDLEKGKLKRRTRRVAEPSEELLRRIARESVWAVRDYRIRAATERRRASERERRVHDQGAALDAAIERAVRQAGDAAGLRAENDRLRQELESLRAQLREAGANTRRLEIERATGDQAAKDLRERLAETRTRAERMEQEAERRAEQLVETRAELARARDLLKARDAQIEQLEEQLEERLAGASRSSEAERRLAAERDAVAERVRAAEARVRELEAVVVEAREGESQAATLAESLDQARARLGRLQSELDDSLRRLDRAQTEQKTLSSLSRQQAKELIVVRRRLEELLASRWRKLGQRIGVAMVLPWEQEQGNGRKA